MSWSLLFFFLLFQNTYFKINTVLSNVNDRSITLSSLSLYHQPRNLPKARQSNNTHLTGSWRKIPTKSTRLMTPPKLCALTNSSSRVHFIHARIADLYISDERSIIQWHTKPSPAARGKCKNNVYKWKSVSRSLLCAAELANASSHALNTNECFARIFASVAVCIWLAFSVLCWLVVDVCQALMLLCVSDGWNVKRTFLQKSEGWRVHFNIVLCKLELRKRLPPIRSS